MRMSAYCSDFGLRSIRAQGLGLYSKVSELKLYTSGAQGDAADPDFGKAARCPNTMHPDPPTSETLTLKPKNPEVLNQKAQKSSSPNSISSSCTWSSNLCPHLSRIWGSVGA